VNVLTLLILCLISGAGVIETLSVWWKTRYRLHLLIIPIIVACPMGFVVVLMSPSSIPRVVTGARFFLIEALGLPPLVFWAESFTRGMEAASRTGQFSLGLPMPSASYQLLGSLGKIIQELAKPIVVVDGPEKINHKIAELAESEPIIKHMKVTHNGRFYIDSKILPAFDMSESVRDKLVLLVDYLVQETASRAGRISRSELEGILRSRVASITEEYRDLLIEFGLFDRLAKGVLSDRISSGLTDCDLAMKGGYPRQSAILLCGPPSDSRELLLNSFIAAGLTKGDSCLYVTSTQPPENVKRIFGRLARDLVIVDCYTSRVEEVGTISRDDNVITSPIEISVVYVAISRGIDKDPEKMKRAVIDILPTYLIFQTVEKLYTDIMEIIDDLRKAGYTTMFSLNPYALKDQGDISTLEELFDSVIYVERTADSSGMKDEIVIRIDKMLGPPLLKSKFKIARPTRAPWSRRTVSNDFGGESKGLPEPVEA